MVPSKKWTNNQIDLLSYSDLLMKHYTMGVAKSGAINQFEPLSRDP